MARLGTVEVLSKIVVSLSMSVAKRNDVVELPAKLWSSFADPSDSVKHAL